MVEVFKTDVRLKSQARGLRALLCRHFPESRISFDLEDCDKVLRLQGEGLCPVKVVQLVTAKGFRCEVLE